MHDLFTKVLAKRDLSRAGDLFSVADSEIVADLNEVVSAGFPSFLEYRSIIINTRRDPKDLVCQSYFCTGWN